MNIEEDFYQNLIHRVGKDHLIKRLIRQVNFAAKFYAKGGYTSFHIENMELIYIFLKYFLKLIGLYKRGLKNSVDYKIEQIPVYLKNLPPQFNNFKILQLSDMHANMIYDEGRGLINTLKKLKADLCILTGDYRFLTHGSYKEAIEQTKEIVKAIDATHGFWGILGNHDFIEFVPGLEDSGIKILLNESVKVQKDGAEFYLAGIDDAHLYSCHDIYKALSGVPSKAITILLSHTPETFVEANEAGVDYLVCGHTHGGQICLPGGVHIFANAKCPRKLCSGLWRYKNLLGYTSRGTGSSSLNVRFFCPPEITIHELKSTI
ncbi:MAG: metallophosphoesterase [Desulfobacterales bacterium]|nr:metallophosphoesterase [Desulfobacterales bacterium]MBF0397886.1 metallophosphoesterase [Desulfobacterales bacterium]